MPIDLRLLHPDDLHALAESLLGRREFHLAGVEAGELWADGDAEQRCERLASFFGVAEAVEKLHRRLCKVPAGERLGRGKKAAKSA